MVVDTTVKRPIMRYHGGKWRLAKWIIDQFPQHRVYVEPFGGAGSVLLQKPRAYAEVYNDLDSEIVNLFRILRDKDKALELAFQLALTPFARDEFELSYCSADDDIEQARRTIARAAMGRSDVAAMGGVTGFRSNVTRTGTIPAHDWASFPAVVPQIVDRLRGVIIENRPAIEVIKRYDSPETLFYLDPPYPLQTRKTNGAYRHELIDDQHEELAHIIKKVRGMVIISGYPCKLYDDLYSDWMRVDRSAHADMALYRTECLWIKPQLFTEPQP